MSSNAMSASLLGCVTVSDLVSSKQMLVEVDANESLGSVLQLLDKHQLLSVPVYGKPGSWIGAGGTEFVVGSKQYIGIVSVLDIISFAFRSSATGALLLQIDEARLPSALSSPVSQALGSTNESLSLWIELPHLDVLSSIEQFAKGVHRTLVPLKDGEDTAMKVLTQTDVLKYLMEHRASSVSIERLMASSLQQLRICDSAEQKKYRRRQELVTVKSDVRLVEAVYTMLQTGVHAVAVIHEKTGALVSTLSMSNFRGVVASMIPTMHGLTVFDFLKRQQVERCGITPSTDVLLPTPLTCELSDTLADVVDAMLMSHVHRSWFVNAHGHPTDVITFTDVIRTVYNSENAIVATAEAAAAAAN